MNRDTLRVELLLRGFNPVTINSGTTQRQDILQRGNVRVSFGEYQATVMLMQAGAKNWWQSTKWEYRRLNNALNKADQLI